MLTLCRNNKFKQLILVIIVNTVPVKVVWQIVFYIHNILAINTYRKIIARGFTSHSNAEIGEQTK